MRAHAAGGVQITPRLVAWAPMSSARVEVLLFAGLRQRAGAQRVSIELESGANVAELRRALQAQVPQLGPLEHCRIAVDQVFASDDTPVHAGQELALIPPVSGGHDGADVDPALPARGSHSELHDQPLSLDAVVAAVSHPGAGGITTFTGQVRRQSRGLEVEHLEYEAYAPMAVSVMDRIAREIEGAIDGAQVCIHHRVGHLEVGEIAVVIAASAPHRAEAFDACRRTIEALKRDVPIWKKEFDAHGGSWIGQGP